MTTGPPHTSAALRPSGSLGSPLFAVDDVWVCGDVGLKPYRHLALRVLARAFQDLRDPGGSATDRESARVFLAGSSMMQHWCRVAAVDPSSIAKHAANGPVYSPLITQAGSE